MTLKFEEKLFLSQDTARQLKCVIFMSTWMLAGLGNDTCRVGVAILEVYGGAATLSQQLYLEGVSPRDTCSVWPCNASNRKKTINPI